MKSLTIHNIDVRLMDIIERKAAEWDLSLNKTIKKLLRQQLLNEPELKDGNPFNDIAGKWTEAEHNAFTKNTTYFSQIDGSLWE